MVRIMSEKFRNEKCQCAYFAETATSALMIMIHCQLHYEAGRLLVRLAFEIALN